MKTDPAMLPIHFAPLQGYTEDVYRRCHQALFKGITTYYTPFVRLEHKEIRSKDLRDLKPENNAGVSVIPQLIASDGKELTTLLDLITPFGYKRIDLNMGCPFPLQTRHGRGAGILVHPEKVQEICQFIQEHPEINFSVKMRLGLESDQDWKQILPILNDTPLTQITLHPRIASQQYKGRINLSEFEAFLAQSKHQVIYNGDVTTLAQIQELEKKYPLAGIMIGRGLLARPSLAQEYQEGKEESAEQIIRQIAELHAIVFEQQAKIIPSESQLLQKMQTFWDFMEETLGRKAWKKIEKAGNLKNYWTAIRELR